MSITLRITGVSQMQQRLKDVKRAVRAELKKAVRLEGELIKTDAQTNYIPVDFGTLLDSAIVNPVEETLTTVTVRISVGGASAPYALAIHEHPDFDPPSWEGKTIKFNPEGRGPKFLELPMNAAIAGMATRIANAINL